MAHTTKSKGRLGKNGVGLPKWVLFGFERYQG